MAYNSSNIFQNPGIKNSPEKGRYSDPSIPGMGSLQNQDNQKPMKKQDPCDCPKDLDNCNCE